MIKKNDLEEFVDNPPYNETSFNANRLLFRKVRQFINATVKHRSFKQGKANAYRHLVRYYVELRQTIDDIEAELLTEMKENESIYFPDGKEKLTKKNGELLLHNMSSSKTEWKKAYKQMLENKNAEGSSS